MDAGAFSWSLQTIVGVALLLAVLLWVLLRNRRSRSDEERTENSTRALYEEEDARRDPSDDGTI